jgi:hypothetical protein
MASGDAQKKPKRSRFTLGPIYLAAGLAVCFLVLTRMVPTMHALTDDAPGRARPVEGWAGASLAASDWVRAHSTATIVIFAAIAVGGFAMPLVVRPSRFLVWLAALAVFLLDVALAAGGYLRMIMRLLDEANAD